MLSPVSNWLLIVIDVSVKSLLLALVAFALLRLLKIRSSSVRHRVWAGVLCGMLALPVLSRVLPALPLPIDVDLAWLEELDEPADSDSAPLNETLTESIRAEETTPADAAPVAVTDSYEVTSSPWQTEIPPDSYAQLEQMPFEAETGPANLDFAATPVASEPEDAYSLVSPAAAKAPTPWYVRVLRFSPMIIVGMWLCGAVMLLLRLLLGLLATNAIVRRGRLLKDLPELRRFALGSGLLPVSTRPVIRESNDIRVPVTVGLLRPTILMPSEWREWSSEKLDAVMTHETTHVERRDFLFAVLAEMNRCLYWFNPLSWWLRTRLSDLAEEACDDAAIDRTGDPAGYARHLLEVAAAVTRDSGRVCQPGLSMARQSNVEGRIHTILDITRPLSERLTWKATLAIVAVMVPAIALAAALKPGGEPRDPEPVEESTVTQNEGAEATADEPGDDSAEDLKEVTMSGKVVDPDGKPIAGVDLYFGSENVDAPFAVTNADGTFSATVDVDRHHAQSSVIAVDPQHRFGFGHSFVGALDESGQLLRRAYDHPWIARVKQKKKRDGSTIRLVKDEAPIEVRVVNQEGQPVVGARAQLLRAFRGRSGSLDEWRAAAASPDADYLSTQKHLQACTESATASQHIAVSDPSNKDGRLTVRGIGRDSIVTLAIHGPNIASAKRSVVTASDGVITIAAGDSAYSGESDLKYQATSFTHVAAFSQPVVGQVTSRKTKQPVPGCKVRVFSTSTDGLLGSDDDQFITATTDDDGRYRLEGLPLGKNMISAIPPSETDLIQIQNQITTKVSSQPYERNLYLATGVRIKGRVTDKRTGQPADGHLQMFAYRGNPLLQGNRRIRLSMNAPAYFETNDDGEFEAVVVPGKGVLAFGATQYEDFLRGIGREKLTGSKFQDTPAFNAVPTYFYPGNFAALYEYDVKPGDAPTADIQVDSGGRAMLRVVDAGGQPVSGFQLSGGSGNYFAWETIEESTCEVVRLAPGVSRRVYIWHAESNTAGTALLTISGDGDEASIEEEVRLQPAGTIRGRVVNRDGEPWSGLHLQPKFPSISDRPEPDLTDVGYAPGTWGIGQEHLESEVGKSVTDSNGRFALPGILPGLKYSVRLHGPAEISDQHVGMGAMGGPMIRYGIADLFDDVVIEQAESKDVGTTTVGRSKKDDAKISATSSQRKSVSNTDNSAGTFQPAAPTEPQTTSRAGSHRPAVASNKPSSTQARAVGTGPTAEDLTITGKVTVESGSPKMIEVSIHLVSRPLGYGTPRNGKRIASVLTTPGQDFKLTIPARLLPKELNYRQWLSVQASVKPYGNEKKTPLGMAAATIRDVAKAKDVRLHMRTEQPITGRLLNLEGQPVVGGRVRILNITAQDSTALDAWLEARRNAPAEDPSMMFAVNAVSMFDTGGPRWKGPQLKPTNFELPVGTFKAVATKEAGEFQLRGIGRDQMLQVEVSGPLIATTTIDVLARDMTPKQVPGTSISNDGQAVRLERSAERIHGSRFSYVAAPSALVTGVVRDKDSKEPIAGLTISVEGLAGSPMSRTGWMKTTTDENGRYTLNGLPTAADVKRYRNRIAITATNKPYISTDFNLPSSPGTDPIEFNMELQQAVLATGRLTDKATGKPVQASLHYTPFSGNPANPDYKRYADETRYMLGNDRKYVTDADGRFQIPVIPGRGVIGVICNDNTFRRAVGIEGIPEFAVYLKPNGRRQAFGTTNDYLAPLGMHVVKAIDVPSDSETFNIDLQADAGDTVRLHIAAVDSDGKLIKSKLWVQGAQARHAGTVTTNTFVANVTGLDPGESRRVYVHDEAHTIGVVGDVTARNKDSKIVAPPLATVKGQLVGVKGNPLKERSVTAVVPDATFYQVVEPTTTDDEGHFELIIPVGGPFNIMTEIKPGTKNARPVKVKSDLTVSEQVVDVGVVRLPGGKPKTPQVSQSKRKQPPLAATPAIAIHTADEERAQLNKTGSLTVQGQVVDKSGQPISTAILYGPYLKTDDPISLDDIGYTKLGTTDANGQFEVQAKLIDSFTKKETVIIHKPGYAVAWFDVKHGENLPGRTVTLQPEQIIKGRLLTMEGRPVVGAVVPSMIYKPNEETLDEFLAMFLKDANMAHHRATTWLAGAKPFLFGDPKCDDSGRFEIHGVAAEHICNVEFKADGQATTKVWIVNRPGVDPRKYNSSEEYARGSQPTLAAPDQTHVMADGLRLAGKVVGEDGTPIAGALIHAATGFDAGGMVKTNDNGRYEFHGLPRVEPLLVGVAPPGYMSSPRTDVYLGQSLSLKPKSTDEKIDLDFSLKKGIEVLARVIDPLTGTGIRGSYRIAPVRGNKYASLPGYDRHKHDSTSSSTNKDGTFRFVTIPGPQVLMIQASDGRVQVGKEQCSPFRQAAFSKEDSQYVTVIDRAYDRFFYSGEDNRIRSLRLQHAVKFINPAPDTEPIEVELTLDRGKTVDVKFVDESGTPLKDVFVSGVSDTWKNTARIPTSDTTVMGLGEDRPRQLVCLHERRNLAGTFNLTGNEKSPLVLTLKPASSIRGRAIDSDGNVIANREVALEFKGSAADELYRFHDMHRAAIKTDKQGYFELNHVVPSIRFRLELQSSGDEPYFRAKLPEEKREMQPGTILVLGDVTFEKV